MGSRNAAKKISGYYKKNKKMIGRIPKDVHQHLKNEIFKKYEIKSFQEVFDLIIVSGIVYLDPKVVKYIDDRVEPFIERHKQFNLANLGTAKRPKMGEYHTTNFSMYPSEYDMLCKFLVEKNYKQQWIYEIVYRGVSEEEKLLLDMIKKGKNHEVRKRKKTLARLSKDEWISAIDINEAGKILDQLTDEYEERKFDEYIQAGIDDFFAESQKEIREEEELDEALNKKMEFLRRSRAKQASSIANKVYLDEG